MPSPVLSLSPTAVASLARLGTAPPDSAGDVRERAPALADAVLAWRDGLAAEKYLVIDDRGACETVEDFRRLCLAIAMLLGELVVQNVEGATIIEVYDRGIGGIRDGVRYHQTRQGGDIHTDSVNHPMPFRYLVLGCVAPALVGGESIIVRAADVVSALQPLPDVLRTLQARFWFEGRGMGEEVNFFQVPVLAIEGGVPRFRYLRSYIEGAHAKVGEPLSPEQAFAFDALDAVLESSTVQRRFMLRRGQVLVCLDAEVFHGRTSFVAGLTSDRAWAAQRRMLRLWVR